MPLGTSFVAHLAVTQAEILSRIPEERLYSPSLRVQPNQVRCRCVDLVRDQTPELWVIVLVFIIFVIFILIFVFAVLVVGDCLFSSLLVVLFGRFVIVLLDGFDEEDFLFGVKRFDWTLLGPDPVGFVIDGAFDQFDALVELVDAEPFTVVVDQPVDWEQRDPIFVVGLDVFVDLFTGEPRVVDVGGRRHTGGLRVVDEFLGQQNVIERLAWFSDIG